MKTRIDTDEKVFFDLIAANCDLVYADGIPTFFPLTNRLQRAFFQLTTRGFAMRGVVGGYRILFSRSFYLFWRVSYGDGWRQMEDPQLETENPLSAGG